MFQNWFQLQQMMHLNRLTMNRNSISFLLAVSLFLASCTIAGIGRKKELDRIAGILQLQFHFEDNTTFNIRVDLRSGHWSGEGRDHFESRWIWRGRGACEYSLNKRRLVLFLKGENEQNIEYGLGDITISVYGEFWERNEGQLFGPLTGTAYIDKNRLDSFTPLRIRGEVISSVIPPLNILSTTLQRYEIDDPRVVWLKEQSIKVRSVSPEDEDFSDLQPLKTVIGDSRIVMLGEQSHGDGTTFLAKTRLIKFLHQEMGFDVLAIESGLYGCDKAWQFLVGGENSVTAVRRGVNPIWTGSEQFQPLIDYLGDQASSERPLELAGFDCQFTGSASRDYLVTELEEFLNEYGLLNTDDSSWHSFRATLSKLINGEFYNSPSPSEVEKAHFYDMLGACKLEVDDISIKNPQVRGQFWAQLLRSMEVQASIVWTKRQEDVNMHRAKLRDLQMGRNLLWLSESHFKNRRIIVWAATAHIVRNMSPGGITQPMGHVVWQALGDQVYVLGFTALEGQAGVFYKTPFEVHSPDIGSIEYFMGLADLEYAIVDFRNPPSGGEWLQEELACRALGYSPITAFWADSLDGIMFTRLMIPSTRVIR